MIKYLKKYYKVIKTIWDWHKNEHIDQLNRTESRNKLSFYSQMTFDKDAKTIQWRKNGFQEIVLGQMDMQVGTLLHTIHKNLFKIDHKSMCRL